MAVLDIDQTRDLIEPGEFVAQLEAIRDEHSVCHTPFVKAIAAGTAPISALRRFSLEWYQLTLRTAPPQVRSPFSYRRESDEVLGASIGNAMGEVGYQADPPHPYLARELCVALGIDDDEIESYVPTPLMLSYMAFAYLGTYGNYDSVGVANRRVRAASHAVVEGDASKTSTLLVDSIREHYGLSDQAVSYWIVHGYADAAHSEEGAAMAVQMCSTRADQDAAIQLAERSIRTRNMLWISWGAFLDE